MDLNRWKRLDNLLQSVLERPLEERDAFLRRACAGDEALERRIRALLSAEQEAKSFLERPALTNSILRSPLQLSDIRYRRALPRDLRYDANVTSADMAEALRHAGGSTS
jgi:hypothetical protein